MCRFINITQNNFWQNLDLIVGANKCYKKYYKYFQDDFAPLSQDIFDFIKKYMPYFWVAQEIKTRNFMGFLALDNFIGDGQKLYSAEITVCFDKKAWGSFTRYCGKLFLKKCFDELGLQKIKAVIYSDNFRVRPILKSSGFRYEATLLSETLRNGIAQDIEIYSIYRTYFYKNEGKINE